MIAALMTAPALAGWRVLGYLVCFGAVVGGAYAYGHHEGYAALKADWDAQALRQQKDYSDRLADYARDQKLKAAEYQRKEVIYEVRNADSERRAAALADLLRKRPQRPAAVPTAASGNEAASCGTGAGLYREDAEFLVGEARRANDLRAALERCQGGDLAQEGGRLDR